MQRGFDGGERVKGWNGNELPCEECGGKCCKYAPIEMPVWDKVKDKINLDDYVHDRVYPGTSMEAMVVWKKETDGECAFLENGRCSIYSDRPKSCRAVGTTIPCAYVDPEAVDRFIRQAKKRLKGRQFISEKYSGNAKYGEW